MMINKDNEYSTDTVTTESKALSSHENNLKMLPTVSVSNNSTGEEQSVQNAITDHNNGVTEKESQDNQLVEIQNEDEEQQQQQQEGDDDEFIRITAAHQMLTEAQTYDEQKKYPAALHLYRICVDLLLEELMFTEGTEQSRVYLREKCTAIMDRVDVLKTMLEPIPPSDELPALTGTSTTITTTNEDATNPPTDELNSLHLS